MDGEVVDGSIAELTAVQQVSLLTLRLRALDASSDTPMLGDALSVQLAESLGSICVRPRRRAAWSFVHAVRDKMLDRLMSRFITGHPTAVVVDLGCGLDTRRQRCAPPPGVDCPDVVVAAFPSMARARQWYGSTEYAVALEVRRTALRRNLIFVAGVDEGPAPG